MVLKGDIFDPLVSIIIPAYNSERWIEETIKSALAQTWHNKEIIVVDDGSRDNTLSIAKKFESTLVHVISKENGGASSARNKGLSFAKGDFIQWLDSDDILAPDKIEIQLNGNIGLHNSLVLLSSAFGMFYHRHEKAIFKKTLLWDDLDPIDYLLNKFERNLWMQPAAWLVSRRITDLAGMWNEKLSLDDDGEYFCRVVAASKKIKFVEKSKSFYRVGNMGSLSMNKSDEALESLILATSLCFDHLKALENSERTRAACLKLLQNRLWYFYPTKHGLLNKAKILANSVGGSLILPPDEGRAFSLIVNILGWKLTMYLRSIKHRNLIVLYSSWDKFMYNLNRARNSKKMKE